MANTALEALAPHFFQLAYVVRDIAEAESWFTKTLGVPRWTRMEDMAFGADCDYRGRAADYVIHLSLGYMRETQIELIEAVRGESPYAEFLEAKGPGLHHIAFDLPDFDSTLAALKESGLELLSSGQLGPGNRFAYFDCEAAGASVIEILGFDDSAKAFMQELEKQSQEALAAGKENQ